MARVDGREGPPPPAPTVLVEGPAGHAEVVEIPLPRLLRLVQEDDLGGEERHAVRGPHPGEGEGPRDPRVPPEPPPRALPFVEEDLELEGSVRGARGDPGGGEGPRYPGGPPEPPRRALPFVEEYLELEGPVRGARVDLVVRRADPFPVGPRDPRRAPAGHPLEPPAAQVVPQGPLVPPEDRDLDVLVGPRLPLDEEVDRPAPRDPPRTPAGLGGLHVTGPSGAASGGRPSCPPACPRRSRASRARRTRPRGRPARPAPRRSSPSPAGGARPPPSPAP